MWDESWTPCGAGGNGGAQTAVTRTPSALWAVYCIKSCDVLQHIKSLKDYAIQRMCCNTRTHTHSTAMWEILQPCEALQILLPFPRESRPHAAWPLWYQTSYYPTEYFYKRLWSILFTTGHGSSSDLVKKHKSKVSVWSFLTWLRNCKGDIALLL